MHSPLQRLQHYGAILQALRAFFLSSNALEVLTPVLSSAGITDPNIHSLQTNINGSLRARNNLRYLHTSPEFPMKRLLAEGCGDIYQICKVFRAGEQGRLHNPEFTLCEWYRVGWDHRQLMQEMDTLLQQLWQVSATQRSPATRRALPASNFLSYADALKQCCGLDLFSLDICAVRQCLQQRQIDIPLDDDNTLDDWLDLLMSVLVFPSFARDRFTFLYDYPASQAALARIGVDSKGNQIAHRFELFYGQVELANGFHELASAKEQRARFEHELRRRQELGLAAIPIDEKLLAALDDGFPDCAGVALGIERLLLVLQDAADLAEVLPLEFDDG